MQRTSRAQNPSWLTSYFAAAVTKTPPLLSVSRQFLLFDSYQIKANTHHHLEPIQISIIQNIHMAAF